MKFKIHCCFGCVLSIHVACLRMCVLFYFSFVCLHVCANAFKFKVYCGSAFEPGASRLPYYCTPPVCVPEDCTHKQRYEASYQSMVKVLQPLRTLGLVTENS